MTSNLIKDFCKQGGGLSSPESKREKPKRNQLASQQIIFKLCIREKNLVTRFMKALELDNKIQVKFQLVKIF